MVEPKKDPDYLRKVRATVAEFRSALESFLELHATNEGATGVARALMPAVFPKKGSDAGEIARRRSAVAQAAGRAAPATPLTGCWVCQLRSNSDPPGPGGFQRGF